MKSLQDLYNSEELFKKVHDAWLEHRLERGDDTPSMVPYDKLPEDIKKFDKITVRTVLREVEKVIKDELPTEEGMNTILASLGHCKAKGMGFDFNEVIETMKKLKEFKKVK